MSELETNSSLLACRDNLVEEVSGRSETADKDGPRMIFILVSTGRLRTYVEDYSGSLAYLALFPRFGGPVRSDDQRHHGGKERSASSKGVKAILHAVVNVALLIHCRQWNLSHLGIIMLDTPLLTYRESWRARTGICPRTSLSFRTLAWRRASTIT